MTRAELGRFDRFRSGKQVARFRGLSPRTASNGQRQGDAGLVDGCNRALRATIVEAAHRLVRHDPRSWRRARSAAGLASASLVQEMGQPPHLESTHLSWTLQSRRSDRRMGAAERRAVRKGVDKQRAFIL